MSNIKISELPEASSVGNNDLLIVVSSGSPYVTKRITWTNLNSDLIAGSGLVGGGSLKSSVTLHVGEGSGITVDNNLIHADVTEAPEDSITYGRRNKTWVDMTSPANLQIRRGTATEVGAITPLEGEPVWKTDEKSLVVGDGQTAGGIVVGPKAAKTVLNLSGFTNVTIPITTTIPPDIIRLSATFPFDLWAITAPNACYEILLINVGSVTVTIKHHTATYGGNPTFTPIDVDRIITPNGSNYTLAAAYSVRLIYDTVTQRWRIT